MKYTLNQLELIAVLFKVQYGDKTFKQIFPDLKYTKHEGTINELTINHDDGDVNFMSNRGLVAYFSFRTDYFSIINDESRAKNYRTKTEIIVKMLNFEDKV